MADDRAVADSRLVHRLRRVCRGLPGRSHLHRSKVGIVGTRKRQMCSTGESGPSVRAGYRFKASGYLPKSEINSSVLFTPGPQSLTDMPTLQVSPRPHEAHEAASRPVTLATVSME